MSTKHGHLVASICVIIQIFFPKLLTGNVLLAYYLLALCHLMSVTTLISSRLLIHRRRVNNMFGKAHEVSNQYLSIVSMMIEIRLHGSTRTHKDLKKFFRISPPDLSYEFAIVRKYIFKSHALISYYIRRSPRSTA